MPKDFAPIETDYAFFSTHSDEPENDAAQHARTLARFAERPPTIRMLDFGCGTGALTERVLSLVQWPPERLELSLVEPVAHQCADAARRLARFTDRPIPHNQRLPADALQRFDLILSNHALYYVDELDATLQSLVAALDRDGLLSVAIAGWDNPLVEWWRVGFAFLSRPVPYHTADDVAASLVRHAATFYHTTAPYRLRFIDTVENRLKILRFLFADHLDQPLADRLLSEFDRYVTDDHVDIHTQSHHFVVEGGVKVTRHEWRA